MRLIKTVMFLFDNDHVNTIELHQSNYTSAKGKMKVTQW